jgi:cystathionine beta-lyase/cystathionine gamma-synthase
MGALLDGGTKAVFCESIGLEHLDDLIADIDQALA